MDHNKLKIFEDKKVRTHWDEQEEKWYFSVVDVCEVLAETDRPRKYWGDLKLKLRAEGSELSDKIGQLKMQSSVRNLLQLTLLKIRVRKGWMKQLLLLNKVGVLRKLLVRNMNYSLASKLSRHSMHLV